MTTKIAGLSAEVAALTSLVTDLVGIVKELRSAPVQEVSAVAPKGKKSAVKVSIAAIRNLTSAHFNTLRYSLVVTDGVQANGKPKFVLDKESNGYKLVKGSQRSWYMGLKGLAAATAEGSISEIVAEGKKRSQMDFAQDLLSEMQAEGFCKINEPTVAKAAKSSKK